MYTHECLSIYTVNIYKKLYVRVYNVQYMQVCVRVYMQVRVCVCARAQELYSFKVYPNQMNC